MMMVRWDLPLGLIVLFVVASFSPVVIGTEGDNIGTVSTGIDVPRMEKVMEKVRDNNGFIENKGQWSEEILFVGNIPGGRIGLAKDGYYFDLRSYDNKPQQSIERIKHPEAIETLYRGHVVKVSFVGCNEVTPEGVGRLETYSNYFIGNDPSKWASFVNHYEEVVYKNVWDGIDLRFYFNEKGLKYDFIVHPCSDPGQIRLGIFGHDGLIVCDDKIEVCTQYGSIVDNSLFVYTKGKTCNNVSASYLALGSNIIIFNIGRYDTRETLVIDPLVYSTFLGSDGQDIGMSLDIDDMKNVYVTGYTYSSSFPTTPGVYDGIYSSQSDVFISKLSSDGSSLISSTYLGSPGIEVGNGIAVDNNQEIYVAGYTSDDMFPTTTNAFDITKNGNNDVFITKFDKSCSKLLYSTYIGGSAYDYCYDLCLDKDHNAIIIGNTDSSDFPTTYLAYDTSFNAYNDIILTKINSLGSTLVYSTYLGGSNADGGYALDIDLNGDIYIAGITYSPDFPMINAFDSSINGNIDAVAIKFDLKNSVVKYSSYLGGSNHDEAFGISPDSNLDIVISGYTRSNDFPISTNAYQKNLNAWADIFVTRLNTTNKNIEYSTYIGGSYEDVAYGMDVDMYDNVYLTGLTMSKDFPVTQNAYRKNAPEGSHESFLTLLKNDCSVLLNSTYWASDYSVEIGRCVKVDEFRNLYATGYAGAGHDSLNFPVTPGAYDITPNGGDDVYISKVKFTSVPSKPLDVKGNIGNNKITLVWKPPIEDGASKIINYSIYKGESINNMSIYKTIGNFTSLTDNNIQNGGTYFYFITANNSIGESYPSKIIRVHDDDPPKVTDLTPDTATTGDGFNISFNVVDNVLVDQVVLVMDDGLNNVTTYHKDFNNNGLCTFKYNAPTRIMDYVMYYVVATDPSGNTGGINGSFRVIDNDPPDLIADKTSYPITTGDEVNFSFDIKDNMGVEWANLTIRYSNDTIREIELVNGPGINWYNSTIFGKSDEFDTLYAIIFGGPPLNMTLSMGDAFGNWRTVRLPERRLVDNDPPLLLEDLTDERAGTGENFTFRFKAMDNIDLSHAEVEYWYMNGTRFRASTPRPLMGGVWETTIKVPVSPPFNEIVYWNRTKIECNLTYSFHIWDSSGNELVSNETQIEILDTIRPELVSHEYIPGTGPTTGDPFEIRVRLKDNIKVRSAYIWIAITHSSGQFYFFNPSQMNRSTSEDDLYYYKFVNIPSSGYYIFNYRIEVGDEGMGYLPYFFYFPTLNITDNDLPTIMGFFTERNTTTGGKLNVWIKANDNWLVSGARMEVWSTGEVKEYVLDRTLSDHYEERRNYTKVLDIPIDSVETLHIILKVTDQSNNTASTPELTIEVIDNIVPSLQPISNITIKKGETLQIAAVATDNIGIDQVHWEGSPITASGLTLEGIINLAGTFIISVTVLDKAGNSNTTSFYLTVEGPEDGKDSSNMVIMIIVALVLLAVIAITIYRVWRSDREPFKGPDDGTASQEPPGLDEGPEVLELPPSPEKEVLIVTIPAPTPASAQAYVPPDQIPAAPMPVQGETGSYIPPPGKGLEPQPLVPRSAGEKMVLEPGQEPLKMLGKEPVEELGPKTQNLLKP